MAWAIFRPFSNCCIALTLCSCRTEGRPFPFLFAYSSFVCLLALVPGLVIAILESSPNCQKDWHALLILYIVLFALDFFFGWYLNFRIYNPRRNVGDDKEGACGRCCTALIRDPGIALALLFFIFDIVYNVVIGYVWASDTDCANLAPNIFNMTRACFVFMWAYLAGILVFGIITMCCDCARPKQAKDDLPQADDHSSPSLPQPNEEPPAKEWHEEVTSSPPRRGTTPSAPAAVAQRQSSRDPNVPDWYVEATGKTSMS